MIHLEIISGEEGDRMSEKLRLYSKAAKSSLENAEQWLKDSKLLLEHRSFGHASALLRFAVEEGVKAYVCWFTSEKIWPIENKMIRDVFWDHTVKNEFFMSFLLGLMVREKFRSWERLLEGLPKFSQEQISEGLEEFEKMIASTERMRQRTIYVDVNPERKEIETPLEIGKEEPKNILMLAESFIKTVRNIVEKMPEDEKAKLRKLFSKIPKEDWKTGELTIDWLPEAMRETS
jgi:AbiV family abortive infection protein